MPIDISQFKNTYIQESQEGLDKIEAVLLTTDINQLDDELINDIFRAAHSIKGGSGTFGFNEVSELTHELETYLDLVRDGKLRITSDGVDVLLQSVDMLRQMIEEYSESDKTSSDYTSLLPIIKALYQEVASDESVPQNIEQGTKKTDEVSTWSIKLNPKEEIFLTGNDPLLFIRELEELGEIVVETDFESIPDLAHFDFESCYLSWQIKLVSNCQKDDITEIFSWIEDDCEIIIEKVAAVNKEASEASRDAAEPIEVKTPKQQEISSIRVNVDKIDKLLNMIGELVITQSMLSQIGRTDESGFNDDYLKKGLNLLEQNTRELQDCVMSIRMVPISYVFDRLPRTVYDVSKKLDKKIDLIISGEGTELDKTVMQQLTDPLTHLIRNAVDHGIEVPAERIKNGKDETGRVELDAYHQSGNIIVSIKDDGAGLNHERILEKAIANGVVKADEHLSTQEINHLVFHPGLSTADAVTDISGRGVGMDVVQRNIRSLGGNIDVESEPGKGSTFIIQLPLTLAILDGQLLRLDKQLLVAPIASIIETLQIELENIKSISSRAKVYRLRDEYIPIINLAELFGYRQDISIEHNDLLVVVENADEKVGLLIDDLLEQQQVVLKSLEENYYQIDGVSGATILGDGTIALVLDIPGIIRMAKMLNSALFDSMHHSTQNNTITNERI